MIRLKKNPHRGARFEEFLEEDGTLETVTAAAQKRVVAWQVTEPPGSNKWKSNS